MMSLSAPHTIACTGADYADWHRGRPRYAVWAIAAETPAILGQINRLQTELASWLLPGYVRQPHLTLMACGFPWAGTPRHDDDFSPADLKAQVAALRRNHRGPFQVSLDRPGTFLAAPYLSLHDPQAHLPHLRHHLLAAGQAEPGFNPDYLPHLTLGLYAQPLPLDTVQARLAALPAAPLPLAVSRLSLMTYAAPVIGGPLSEVAHFDLTCGQWHETAPGALDALFAPQVQAEH